MCCQNPYQSPGRFTMEMPAAACGCGCLVRRQTDWHLENYREYLKAELTAVERQIQANRNTNS